jgi:magnesium transporter
VIVDCAHYNDGRRQQDGPMDLDRAATIYHNDPDGGFVWLGLFEPSLEELQQVQARFGLHDLAIEDAQTLHLRPKIEQYNEGAITFLVIRTVQYVDETDDVDFGEVSVFVGEHFVITVRQGGASELHGARARLEQRPDLLAEGPDAALWAIMDKIVDDYLPVVQELDRDIAELEETVFTGSVAPSERIYKLRREATEFYRAVHPLLAPLDAIARSGQFSARKKLRPFFRDISDHLQLTAEEISSQRELLGVMLQANLAVISLQQNEISVRQNETSKQLTVIATIFLPLTFITGFFGMNFEWLTTHDESAADFLIWGIGTLIVSIIALAVFFKHRGWFGADDAG